jgi:hypothetical protein
MFDALEAGDFQSIEGIVTQFTSYFNPSPTADPRTRGSVRRASGFVQIPISLIDPASAQPKSPARIS